MRILLVRGMSSKANFSLGNTVKILLTVACFHTSSSSQNRVRKANSNNHLKSSKKTPRNNMNVLLKRQHLLLWWDSLLCHGQQIILQKIPNVNIGWCIQGKEHSRSGQSPLQGNNWLALCAVIPLHEGILWCHLV